MASPGGRPAWDRSQRPSTREAGGDPAEPQRRLLVRERDAPVRDREAETSAPPARLIAERPVAERHPGEVADAIIIIELLGDDRHVAEPAAGGELSGLRPPKITRLQPPVPPRGDHLRPLGDEAQRRAS